ncbi:hypothetical protein ACFLXU_02685 [Chloroflexota bacterium]
MAVDFKTDEERKQARFWQRFFTGAELADRLRFMTLNSSDESVVLGLNVLESFSKLVKRFRRKYGVFEYFGVVEQDKEIEERRHLHLICKGVYMPQREIEDMWIAVHRSIKPYIRDVYGKGGAAGYLGKYLGKERLSRYIWSAGWILPGYVGWSKTYRREFADYPTINLVRQLANLESNGRKKLMRLIR